MKYNLNTYEGLITFEQAVRMAKEKKSIVELKDVKETRTSLQSAARWLYLTMCANELNERGWTHSVTDKLECKYNKDMMYHIYWQPLRNTLFPNKRQLTTKEFCELSDMMMIMMSKLFSLDIPFPSIETMKNEQLKEI